ncbi:MAG: cupredoxin domain-containing protein, partial [Granulicella sp.]
MRWTMFLLLFVACSWGAALAWAQPMQKAAPVTHQIVIMAFQYQPETLTVQVGDTVEWTNKGIVPHTVLAEDGSFKSGLIMPGSSWKVVMKKSGTFPYSCEP